MDLVIDLLENKIKLNKDDKIVVGVSAGPDSMCLLAILLKLRSKLGFTIIVSHINHNKRVESEEEEEFLKEYCKNSQVIFESMKIENYGKDNFHSEARKIRYKFYQDLINKYGASYLMTAHHGDDLIETILMRLVRGSTLNGYKGISLVSNMDNYLIVRPLLYLTKEEIENFDKANNIPYRIDKSNFSDKYTRNRYRHYVLPFLKEENKNVHLKFLKFSNLMGDCSNYIESVVNDSYNKVYKDNKIDISLFSKLDIFIQKLVLESILMVIYTDLNKVESKHIEIILELIKKNKSGSRVNLPGGILVIVDYDYLVFKEKNEELDYKLELKDGLVLPNGMQFIKYNGKENGNDTLHLESSMIELPLYVRNKHDGDVIELKGTSGVKKVSDIFIDKKISREDRKNYPVLVDSNDKVIWVPKLKKSKFDSPNREKCDIIFKCL